MSSRRPFILGRKSLNLAPNRVVEQLVNDWVRHPHAVLHVTNLLQAVHRHELEYSVPNHLGRLQFGVRSAWTRVQDLGSRVKGVGFWGRLCAAQSRRNRWRIREMTHGGRRCRLVSLETVEKFMGSEQSLLQAALSRVHLK